MARDLAAILKAASIDAPCPHITVLVTSAMRSSKSTSAEIANRDRKSIIPASQSPRRVNHPHAELVGRDHPGGDVLGLLLLDLALNHRSDQG